MEHRIGKSFACALAAAALLALPAAADHHEGQAAGQAEHAAPQMSAEDQAMMEAYQKAGTPGAEHKRLAESAGSWKSTVRMWMAPGEPQVSEATSTREMILDGRVMTERFEGNMMGMPFVGHGMTGYDNVRKAYWSTWNDSMSTGIMMSWGRWDEAEKALVFDGEMSNPMTGQPSKVRILVRHPEAGKEVMEMWEPHGEGGELVRTMEITSVKQ